MKPLALITGGQRGIGLGIAKALASNGFALALSADVSKGSDEVKTALAELGPDVRYYQHDIQNKDGVPKLLNAIENDLGPITTFVSNAGVSAISRGDMLELQEDSFDFVMGVNLKGAFFLAQEVARRMIVQSEKTYRSIIFITSINAETASIERAEYCLSKAGAGMMAKLFAARLAPENIGVFDVRPGIIETDMTAIAKDKYSARIEEGLVPAGRWGHPSDIGSAVLPLVNGQMAFANGAVIPVDGGLSIQRL